MIGIPAEKSSVIVKMESGYVMSRCSGDCSYEVSASAVAPTVTSYNYDENTRILTYTFSETIDPNLLAIRFAGSQCIKATITAT